MKLAFSFLTLSQILQVILGFTSLNFLMTNLTTDQGFKLLAGILTTYLGSDVQRAGDVKDDIDDFIVVFKKKIQLPKNDVSFF